MIIGHNIVDFDLPYIYKRAVINNINTYGIKIPVNARHGSQDCYDTMKQWNGWQTKAGGSLDAISRVLGLDEKNGVDLVQKSMSHYSWQVPVIICSADPSEQVREHTSNAKFYFMRKPIKALALKKLIRQLLENK